jgi:hypothetical protein
VDLVKEGKVEVVDETLEKEKKEKYLQIYTDKW